MESSPARLTREGFPGATRRALLSTQTPLSERNVVVHVAVAGAAGCHRPPRRGADRTTGAEITAGIVGAEAAATAAAAAIEHGQGRVEALQHDFGRILLDSALVGPFARLQRALDVHLGALLQILLDNLAKRFGEDHDAVPLRLFLTLAGALVAPGLRRRDAQIGNRPPVLCPPDFRILAEVADQNHLVHASRHRRSPLDIAVKNRRQKSPSKITGPPAKCRPPSILTCRQFLTCRSVRSYASASGHLERPYTLASPADSAIPRQADGYPHIASRRPMFQLCSRNHTSPQARNATQPYGDFSSPQLSPENAKMEPKVPPDSVNNVGIS